MRLQRDFAEPWRMLGGTGQKTKTKEHDSSCIRPRTCERITCRSSEEKEADKVPGDRRQVWQ